MKILALETGLFLKSVREFGPLVGFRPHAEPVDKFLSECINALFALFPAFALVGFELFTLFFG